MKKIIHEVRQQPPHVRELATLLCTIAVVALVGLVWFRSFQKDIYAMLNPSDQADAQDKYFAVQSKSLFGSIRDTFSSGKAQILDLFSGQSSTTVNNNAPPQTETSNQPHPLPVSGDR